MTEYAPLFYQSECSFNKGPFVDCPNRVKEFCSPNCSMKSGRRNTVENFDLLPNLNGAEVTLSAGAMSAPLPAGRYHTLPHNSTLAAAAGKKKNEESPKNESPPKVPPHQHITKSNPDSFWYLNCYKRHWILLFGLRYRLDLLDLGLIYFWSHWPNDNINCDLIERLYLNLKKQLFRASYGT